MTRIPAREIVAALTMLLTACDLFDKDDEMRASADGGGDGNADDGEAEEEEEGEEGGTEEGTGGGDVSGGVDAGGDTVQPEPESCTECVGGRCMMETMPCATDQICQDCVWVDPNNPACADNPAWQQALACGCERCPMSCASLCGG